jgi:ABC-type nitrate/sulfonate/bicarbonate transport system permease component
VNAALRGAAAALAPFAVILVLWQLAAKFAGLPPSLFPPLESIFAALLKMFADGSLAADLAGTFRRLFESVLIGAFFGTVFGTMMGYFKWVERASVAPMNCLLSIPGTPLFPLTLIWFGLSEMAIISILIYEVALTVTLMTWTGVKSIDLALIRAGRVFGARGAGMLWRVLIPAALPSIIGGYRLAFSRAWRILIIAEMLVSVTAGLGYRLYYAREYFHFELVYAGLLVVGVSGLLIERVLLRTLERATVNRWGTVRELT